MANVATVSGEERRCCCGCMTVAQGSFAIGIVETVFSIIGIISYSIDAHNLIHDYGDTVPVPGGGTVNKSSVLAIVFIQIFMMVVYLILSAMMVKGCQTRQHRLMMPWLIWNYVSLTLAALLSVIAFFVLVFENVGAGFIFIFLMAIVLAISAYFVRVVFYHVEELKGRSQPTF